MRQPVQGIRTHRDGYLTFFINGNNFSDFQNGAWLTFNASTSNYSRLSLSPLRLSRITAYLEKKIRSLFKHRNLTSGNKI